MTKQQFSSGHAAMKWLIGGADEPTSTSTKSAKQLEREIDEEIAPRIPGTTGKPLPPFPSGRRGASARPARTPKPASAKPAKAKRGGMTLGQYLDSLPPPLVLRGRDSVTVKKVAEVVRKELAGAVDAGALPEGTKFSVRSDHNSMRVEITHWMGEVFSKRYLKHLMDPKGTPWDRDVQIELRDREHMGSDYASRRFDVSLSSALNKALVAVDKIADRHNYNNSDTQRDHFDVGYYLSVDAQPLEDAAKQGVMAESNQEFRELLRRGEEAAAALGPAATKSICGKSLQHAGEHCLKHLIRLAERAAGRPVVHDPRRGWVPVDRQEIETLANLPAIELGGTAYRVASGSIEKGSATLIGPRGGEAIFIRTLPSRGERERGEVSNQWVLNTGQKSTRFEHKPDGTFTYWR